MSGGSRKSAASGGSAATSENTKRLVTLSVLGLSGAEAQKGASGVGKSVFCNRLVRPHYNDFFDKHITHLSQADFCSPVINQEHWLYWGNVSLDPTDYNGPTQQIRVIEQTVFLDDESFEPLGGTSRVQESYVQRAIRTELETQRNKLMYIGPDQLGQEQDYIAYKLDSTSVRVDAFAILFDVSRVNGRSLTNQSMEVLQLLNGALKTKKPTFLLASKCDQAEVAAIQEFQRLVERRDLQKFSNFHWAETSALCNVNCSEFLYELAKVVDKRGKPRIPSFLDAQQARNQQVAGIRSDFKQLLHGILPREEYPLRHGQLTWPIFLSDFRVDEHPAFMAYVAEFGANSAKQLYEEHLRSIREWWLDRELNQSLPALREVLRRMFNRQFLCKTTWEQLCVELETHPQYNTYFRPFGRSLDKFSQSFETETRIPGEVLQKAEARNVFHSFQRELLDEIALERQTEKFKKLLEQKEAVTPGRSFADVKVMCEEIAAFEQALPADCARWIYDEYQKELKNKAQRDFNELLLENVWLFVDLIVEWRIKQAGDPNRICGLSEREYNIICSTLIEDKRYRDLNGLSEKRKELVSKMASFLSMPLTCFCLAGERCADLVVSTVISDIRHDTNKFCSIDAEVYGNETLVEEFIANIKLVLSSDKLFHHNDRTAKINCQRADRMHENSLQRRSCRVRSPICLLDTSETAAGLLSQADSLFITGPAPIFLSTCQQLDPNENATIQKLGRDLADRFNGVFIGVNDTSDYSRRTSLIYDQISNSSANFSQGQLEQILHEICASQMGTHYADIRIRISFLCDDPFSISQVLSPLLEKTVQTDNTGGCFCVDVHIPDDEMNVRVCSHTGSYHHWLLSKWQLNTFHGHVLIYSPVRSASWRHAEAAIQLLLDAATVAGPASSNVLERQCMSRSILLLAVEDPSHYFTDKDSSHSLSEGARLAERVGCRFMAISPSMPHSAQFQLYSEFFAQLIHNQPMPNLPYTVCAPNPSSFASKRRPTYFSTNATTFTGSASTLLGSTTASSTASRESNFESSAVPLTNSFLSSTHLSATNQEVSESSSTKNTPKSSRHSESVAQHATSRRSESQTPLKESQQPESRPKNDTATRNPTRRVDSLKPSSVTTTKFDLFVATAPTTGTLASPPNEQLPIRPTIPKNQSEQLDAIDSLSIHSKVLDATCAPSTSIGSGVGRDTIGAPPKSTPFAQEMSNRLRRPLSAIGSFMSGGGLHATEPSSHEGSSNSIAPVETHSNKIKFSPSGFRKLFQRNTTGSESSSTDEQARKKLHRSSTVDAGSVIVVTSPIDSAKDANGRLPEVVLASPQNSYTTYVRVDPAETSSPSPPPAKNRPKRPLRAVLKSLSVDSEDTAPKASNNASNGSVRFAPGTAQAAETENIPDLMITNHKMQKIPQEPEEYERPSRLRRFADRFTRKNKLGPRRRQSLPPKRLETPTSSPTSASSSSPVDITYESECQNGDEIPTFARQCIQYIEKNGGLITEGLYRLSGHPGLVAELEKLYRKSGSLCVDRLVESDSRGSRETALVAVSAALKRYLQSFNEPLIPTKLNDELVELIGVRVDIDDPSPLATRTLDSLRRLFERCLPRVNAHLLMFICAHLERVASNSDRNRMTIKNLALIWAGTLFRLPPSTPMSQATDRMQRFPILVYFFIKHHTVIFS